MPRTEHLFGLLGLSDLELGREDLRFDGERRFSATRTCDACLPATVRMNGVTGFSFAEYFRLIGYEPLLSHSR